jgi:DNA-binding SARP family transcriptional activator
MWLSSTGVVLEPPAVRPAPTLTAMEVAVLGPTRILRAGTSIDLPARKVRSLLAALVLEPGATSSADRVIDLVWGEGAPRGAHGTLHSYISGLRRLLEPDLPARAQPRILLTSDAGYRLAIGREAVDATGFADQVRLLHRQVATLDSQFSVGPQAGWPDREQARGWLEALEAALLRWRGPAYADLGDHPDVVAARTALDELRTTAEEDRALLMLALGDPAGVVPATEQATARHPFRERTWAVHALALARSERQADALAAIRGLRTQLADEGAPPLWPWQSILAALSDPNGNGGQPVDLAGLRARLAGDDRSDYAERAFAVSDRLAGMVRDRAARQPLLLIVDDLHWADAPSLRALSHLISTARAGERLAVVLTRRPCRRRLEPWPTWRSPRRVVAPARSG